MEGVAVHGRRCKDEDGGMVAATVARMESCGQAKQTRTLKQRSSSPLAAPLSLVPEQNAQSAAADTEASASCRRPTNAEQSAKPSADEIVAATLNVAVCNKPNQPERSKPEQSTHVAVVESVGFLGTHGTVAAGNANNNSSKNEGLESSRCKEVEAQLLKSSVSQLSAISEHNQGLVSSHPAARGAAAYSTACNVALYIPGEDARGPLGQSGMQGDSAQTTLSTSAISAQPAKLNSSNSRTCPPGVRQNASISILQNSADSSKHSSPLQPQANANQQSSQPFLQNSGATITKQQGDFLQNMPHNFSSPPKQQSQQFSAASPAWARRECVSFGDIDLSTSAHIREGVIQLDKVSISQMQSKLASSLVGKLFGRRLSFHFLAAELHKRWGHYDGFKVLDAGKDCFICQFKNDADRDAIIRSGPWTVAGQILGLDVWSLDFNASSSVGTSTPIWVRLPELPLYCWGKENLARISSDIGVPLWLDPVTANMDKIAFARVCVRVNLAQPLKPGVWIDGLKGKFFQRVEYEGITVICFKCGVVGHRDTSCPLQGPTLPVNESTIPPPAPSNDMMEINAVHAQPDPCENASKESVGPWMLVTNRRKPRNLAGQQPKQVVGNKSKPAISLNSARQQQQQQIATHHQQKNSAQQYRVVGQQGTGAKTPQNSHLNIPTRLNKQKGTVNLQDSAVAIPGLLQKHQKDTVEMVKSTVKMQDSTVEMQDHTVEMRDNTVEVRDNSVEMQGMVQTKQTGTVEMQGSAVAMQGLLQNKQKADCSVQNDNKEVKKAVDFQDSCVQNVVLNAAIENPFVVLDLCMEESDVKPVTNPLILTSLANKKKLKFPLQKFLSPKANTQKGRERISKKHWEKELANLKECVTPASDGKMIKRRRDNHGDTVREGSSPPLNSHPSSSPPND